MKTTTQFPSRLQWTAQELVDAIPLRLSKMVTFAATASVRSANDSRFDSLSPRELRHRYLPERGTLSLFQVRN